VPLATLPSIAACQMRRRMPRRSLQIDIGETDPNPALWLGTILMLAGIVCSLAVDGDVPPVVATFLAGAIALRTVRFQVVQRQRQRYATAARHSDAVRDAQQRASLEALARALEARDGYTGRHGEETVGIAVRVADALGLEPDEIDEVRTVALLHDIGKIGIPNDILHKPGPLDTEEWERMREHPVIGERILRVVPGLERVARAVRHEHERWDGGGYPDGIAGEEIPLASRITLVCDAWHAMTSDRPYRRAMPAEHAVAQLLEHSGSQFDRAVVRALLGVLERDGVAAARAAYQAAA
jgi:HD-GYP domain-containing protein (c-di-GMP phosphodiesterase class II)